MIVGEAGSGKSYAGLTLAIETATKVAEMLGKGTWRKYFNLKKTLAVINRDEIERVMEDPPMHAILLLDDVGVGWNARKYKDSFNMWLNDIIQTFRPNHNLVILTMQSDFLIDKVPRSLAHYFIEMDQMYFELGITVAKVFKIKLKHRRGKVFHIYPEQYNKRYVRYVFFKPPDNIAKKYEAIRAKQLKRMKEEKKQQREEEKKKSTKKQNLEELLVDVWAELKQKGYSYREIAKLTHVDHTHVYTALNKRGLA